MVMCFAQLVQSALHIHSLASTCMTESQGSGCRMRLLWRGGAANRLSQHFIPACLIVCFSLPVGPTNSRCLLCVTSSCINLPHRTVSTVGTMMSLKDSASGIRWDKLPSIQGCQLQVPLSKVKSCRTPSCSAGRHTVCTKYAVNQYQETSLTACAAVICTLARCPWHLAAGNHNYASNVYVASRPELQSNEGSLVPADQSTQCALTFGRGAVYSCSG